MNIVDLLRVPLQQGGLCEGLNPAGFPLDRRTSVSSFRMFLIRGSQQHEQCFVLSLCFQLKAKHYLVIPVSYHGSASPWLLKAALTPPRFFSSAVWEGGKEVLHHRRWRDSFYRPSAAGGVSPDQQRYPARVPETPLCLRHAVVPPPLQPSRLRTSSKAPSA